ncbi:kinase-like domain-containing protein [Leucosporidium creatinivorum]|uniref:Kinase-like domain-containing protein n=1 Tax=Leucosporidium creatinivorum TaxID=106004 RepID=A0A1Y2D103_9BASI|nr:kinase-like domain-containing protein [Leucosporidium creatinivorum]
MAQPAPGVEYGPIRTPLDQAAVERYLSQHIPAFHLASSINSHSVNRDNPTYLLTSTKGTQYVLRKKPPGKLVSQTAHAIEREYRIIEALGKEGSVPVPKVYALCLDASVLGTPFYVMEYLKGRIFTDVRMPELKSKEERRACWLSIIQTLASLHSLSAKEIGLGDFGSTAPFYPRQIKSLTKVSRAQAAVKDLETGKPVGEIPGIDFLLEWYAKETPNGGKREGSVIHGDFKCDNMIFHPTEPRVIGVLDWELSTLGHPYSDLSNLLQPFYIPKQGEGGVSQASHLTALRDIPPSLLPIPDAQTLLQEYCKLVGEPYPLPRWTACVSFAFFRLAVITQGIAARSAQGQASSAKAKTYATIFPQIGELAVDTIRRAGEEGGRGRL